MVEFTDASVASIFAELAGSGDGTLTAAVSGRDADLRDRAAWTLRQDGIEVTVTTSGPDELLAEIERSPVDATICIVSAPEEDIAAVRAMGARPPGSHLVVVGFGTTRARLRRMLDLGLGGFVLEWQIVRSLAPAVRAACSGQVSVPVDLSQTVERRALTRRQRQVLQLAARGRGNAEIAEFLCLSESTVKAHLSAAFARIGVRSRSEAAALMLDPEVGRSLGFRDAVAAGR
jgi:DNA-binding NarL/FixJ family response regulator